VAEYKDLIGIPFEYGGRSLADNKLDCYGLVKVMSERNGIMLPERSVSEDHNLIHALMASQMNVWKLLPGPKEGAVVLFRVKKRPCHVAYMLNEFEFIHTWEDSGGVVIERLSNWDRRIEGFYEYVG
jgi:cell wall-associated NlpC family hydrolase